MKLRMLFLSLALAALLTSFACERGGRAASGAPSTPVSVRTARVGGASEAWIEIPGTVEAARAADIASRVSAVIEDVRVEEGARVKAGELLVLLDGRDLRARQAAAEAALGAATAQRDRIRALFARDAATQQEREAAEADFSAARAERDAARAQIEYVEIRAPFDGRVVEKRVGAGDLAVPGQPLVSIQGTGTLRVTATATKSQAEPLRPGQTVDAVLEGGALVTARLSVLAPAGDPSSLRSVVKADLPRGSGARVGSFARLRLPRGAEEPTPLVPRSAIVERGALTGVFLVEDGRARLRWISPGGPAGELVPVRSGLSTGEEIVLEPARVIDGALVDRNP